MFARKIARSQQTTTAPRATNKLAPHRSTLVGQFKGGAADRAPLVQRKFGQGCFHLEMNEPGINSHDQETRRLVNQGQIPLRQGVGPSWDYSKISIFPPSQQPSSAPLRLQPKLAIGAANDPLEHEADRVADQVMRMPDPDLSIAAAPPQLSRKCSACEKEDEAVRQREIGLGEGEPAKQPRQHGVAPRSMGLLPAVQAAVNSIGQPLGSKTREEMESRFSFDFSQVRIHADTQAAESALAIGALAYTTGREIVFGSGQYKPHSVTGRRLLAHELAHVIQQEAAPAPPVKGPAVKRSPEGAYRIAVAPVSEPESLERQADIAAEWATSERTGSMPFAEAGLSSITADAPAIQRVRIPVPNTPLCGKTLTHIDVLPPATKDLETCLPKGVPVTRINVVGRDLTRPTPGMGNQVFNLHIGYYKDSAGRYCGVVSDSKACVAALCLFLGCFPNLGEVLKKIIELIKDALAKIIPIIILAILIALIIELLGPILVPAAAAAVATTEGEDGGGGEQAVGGGEAEVEV